MLSDVSIMQIVQVMYQQVMQVVQRSTLVP